MNTNTIQVKEVGQVANNNTLPQVGQVANNNTITEVGQIANNHTLMEVGQIANNNTPLEGGQIANSSTPSEVGQITNSNTPEGGQIENSNTLMMDGQITNSNTVLDVGQIANSNTVMEVGQIANNNTLPGVGQITNNNALLEVGQIANNNTLLEVGQIANSNTLLEVGQIANSNTLLEVRQIASSNTLSEVGQITNSNTLSEVGQITNSNALSGVQKITNNNTLPVCGQITNNNSLLEDGHITNSNTLSEGGQTTNNIILECGQIANSNTLLEGGQITNNDTLSEGGEITNNTLPEVGQITNSNTLPQVSSNAGGDEKVSNNADEIKRIINTVTSMEQFRSNCNNISGIQNIPGNIPGSVPQITNNVPGSTKTSSVPGIGQIPNSNALPRIGSIVSGIGQRSLPSIEHISNSSTSVPGIECLLKNELGNVSSALANLTYQQLANFESSNKNKVTFTMETLEGKGSNTIVTGVNTSNNTNTVTSLVKGVPTVNKELPVPRKPVGIRGPIAIREQTSTSTSNTVPGKVSASVPGNMPGNVPGIEYLLNNDMRNVSMANPLFTRHYEQQVQQLQNVNNDKVSIAGVGVLSAAEDKTIGGNHSNIVVSRHVETGRKSVGIREPIAFRDGISIPNPVPGVEYLFHGGVPTGVMGKKMRMPKEDRPFLCQTCGNKFRQQSHLQQHIRIHTNDRPYQCRFCEKAFKQKSQLNQHERIHTGEKPYKCLICEKAFAQAGQLYSHKKTHGLNMDEIKQQQREVKEKTASRKRAGGRPKCEDIPAGQLCSPPSVIYIMESLPRAQHSSSSSSAAASSSSSYLPFPMSSNDNLHTHMFNNGLRYQTSKLPKIETVVSLGPPRPRSSVPLINSASPPPPAHHYKNEPPKVLNTDS